MTEHMEFTKDKIIIDKKWFVWNAFGKESFDSENKLTDEEWKEFITQCIENDIALELEDWHMNYFNEYCYRIGKRDKDD